LATGKAFECGLGEKKRGGGKRKRRKRSSVKPKPARPGEGDFAEGKLRNPRRTRKKEREKAERLNPFQWQNREKNRPRRVKNF